MAQTDNERLQKLEEKIAQLKAQKQAIVNREKIKERKERTRRLIQNGALAEKYLNCEGISPEDFEKVLLELVKGTALVLESSLDTGAAPPIGGGLSDYQHGGPADKLEKA